MKLKLVILGLLFYTISYSQKRPEPCDVVLGGKKEGIISLEILKKYKKINFYNNKCNDSIIGYQFMGCARGKSFTFNKKTNIISLEILNIICNYTSSQKVLFNVDILSDEGVMRKQIIQRTI